MRTDYMCVLAAVLSALAAPALAQVPDNRGVGLDPEDSVPPSYRDTLEERDRQRLDAARAAGETFIPVFQGRGTAPAVEGDPPSAVRDAAPAPPQAVYEGYRRPETRRPGTPEDGARGAGDLIGVLIEAWTRQPEIVRLGYPQPEAHAPEERAVARDAERDPEAITIPGIASGRGLYARTLYAVDSDYPGPVLLELLEPPLAGAVASGAFTRVGERLVLRLSRLEYRGRSVPVDAWAVGLDCACFGVEGEVDSHWFSRVLLPAAVRFAEGFLDAISRSDETVIVGGDVRYERRAAATRDAVNAGLATAARSAGDVLLENAPDGPTVRIARDTELVVVFAAPPGGAQGAGTAGDE